MSDRISPTFIQDQLLLRNFYRMPNGVWGKLGAETLAELQRLATSLGWGDQNYEQYRFSRDGNRLLWRRENEQNGRLVLDFATVKPEQSLALALALPFAFAFAFAFADVAFALAFAFTSEPSTDIPFHWSNFCETNRDLLLTSRAEGFQIGYGADLKCVGEINPDATVNLHLTDLPAEKANQILGLLYKERA